MFPAPSGAVLRALRKDALGICAAAGSGVVASKVGKQDDRFGSAIAPHDEAALHLTARKARLFDLTNYRKPAKSLAA